jgi:hypothetical protein
MNDRFLFLVRCLLSTGVMPMAIRPIVFTIVAAGTAFSQDNGVQSVELKPEVIFFQNREFYVDSIVDARPVKMNIGTAQINKRDMEVQLDAPFVTAMKKYLGALTPPRTGMQRLVLIVNELTVSEKVNSGVERGVAAVDLTFCRIHVGRLMAIGSFKARESSSELQPATAIAARIGIVLRKCLLDFNGSGWQTREPEDLVKYDDFVRTDMDHDILFSRSKNAGIYAAFPQLRSNAPNARPATLVEKQGAYVASDSLGQSKIVDAFGMCDGKNIFINTRFYNVYGPAGVFAKVIEEGHYMVWKDDAPVGGKSGNRNSSPYLVVLDMRTGTIIPLTTVKRIEGLFRDDRLFLENFQRAPNNHLPSVIISYIISYNKSHPLL